MKKNKKQIFDFLIDSNEKKQTHKGFLLDKYTKKEAKLKN